MVLTDDISGFLRNVTYRTSDGRSGSWNSPFLWGIFGAGDTGVLTLIGTVLPSITHSITNIAGVTSPNDPNAQPGHPKTASVDTPLNTLASMSITKNAPASVIAGNNLVYTVVVRNNGPSDAQNVMFNDVIPLLSGVTWSLNGIQMGGWMGSYNLGLMIPGQAYTLLFTGFVPASTPNGTVLNNTASVTSPTDPVEHNATAITNVKTQADLYIKKTGDAVVLPGGNINYTIFIKNNGPSDALNVYLYDGLDSLLTSAEYSLTGDQDHGKHGLL